MLVDRIRLVRNPYTVGANDALNTLLGTNFADFICSTSKFAG